MRYINLKSFQKHLEGAAPHHFCRCYLILIPFDYERRKVFEEILLLFRERGEIARFSGASALACDILNALVPPLFGKEALVVVDELEKMAKNEQQLLFEGPFSATGYLLLGARAKVPISSFAEKEGVVLDLTEEKPWEREKRLALQLEEKVQKGGKRLASDVIPLLFERCGVDLAVLDSEVDKLLSFVGERKTVERFDVFRVGSFAQTFSPWQIAEEIVWEGRGKEGIDIEGVAFPALLPAIRSQLQIGLKISSLLTSQVPQEEWAALLPRMWPKTLEKRKKEAAARGLSYFRKGLDLLFEIELLSRTDSSHFDALLALFRCSLYAKR